MEMFQGYIEWVRYQRYGKIEEDELEEDTVKDEVADQVLKLDMSQRRSTKNISKSGGKSKMFGATASSKGSDSRTTFTMQTNYAGAGLANQPSSLTQTNADESLE